MIFVDIYRIDKTRGNVDGRPFGAPNVHHECVTNWERERERKRLYSVRSLGLRSTWRSWNHFIIVVYQTLNKDKLIAASGKWNAPLILRKVEKEEGREKERKKREHQVIPTASNLMAGRRVRNRGTMWLRSFDLVRLTLTLSSDKFARGSPRAPGSKTHPHPEAHPDALKACTYVCASARAHGRPSRSAMWNDLHSRHVHKNAVLASFPNRRHRGQSMAISRIAAIADK